MKVIGVYSIKGGVGKTASAVNLAYLAAESGLRTLLWDLDPQGASSFYFRVKPKVKGGVKRLLGGKRGLGPAIKGTDFVGLDLLPADFSARNLDLLLEERHGPTKWFARLLRHQHETYDLVILDCPPSISRVSENVFRAADLLLVPTIPTILSARTLEQLLELIGGDSRYSRLRVAPFFSMVDRRKRLHLEQQHRLRDHLPGFLESVIPYSSKVESMGIHRLPVPVYAGDSSVSAAYRALWGDVRAMLDEPSAP